ncbi:peptidylprolyl isomerase [Sporosarcina beigongshangi]|uniref:peptidylprolyl isomerase n=1 Tax=Sporosarcina beigongshangi TaxID=2782538 RepID=UPI00193AA4B4|nr:peptidylprolyl isomerase [Sporosarcina beigongshangi]
MKKTVLALTMAASVLALSACSDKNTADEAVITSKIGDITKNEFYEEMKIAGGEQILLQMTVEKVLNDKYKVSDQDVEDKFKEIEEQYGEGLDTVLAQQGLTKETLKKQLRFELLNNEAVTEDIEVSAEEIAQRGKELNTELHVRHILVEDEETALEVIKKLEGGAAFADLAKEFSTDPGSKDNGGEYEWFGFGKMVPEFWSAAYNLEPSQISEPVQSSHGFHIIETLGKRDLEGDKATKVDEDKVRKELALEKADQNAAFEKVAKLIKEADIKIKDADLKATLDMFKDKE